MLSTEALGRARHLLIWLFVASLLISAWPLRVGPVVIYPPELILYPVVLKVLFSRGTRSQLLASLRRLPTIILAALGLIALGAAAGFLVAPSHYQALGALKAWLLDPMLVAWLILAFAKPQERKTFYWAMLATGLGVMLLTFVNFERGRWSSPFPPLQEQAEVWHLSTFLIDDRPLTGTGLRGYEPALRQALADFHLQIPTSIPAQPNNFVLSLWLNIGAFGVVGFLLLISLLLREGKDLVAKRLIAIWVAIGLVATCYWQLTIAVVVWIWLGFLLQDIGRGQDD